MVSINSPGVEARSADDPGLLAILLRDPTPPGVAPSGDPLLRATPSGVEGSFLSPLPGSSGLRPSDTRAMKDAPLRGAPLTGNDASSDKSDGSDVSDVSDESDGAGYRPPSPALSPQPSLSPLSVLPLSPPSQTSLSALSPQPSLSPLSVLPLSPPSQTSLSALSPQPSLLSPLSSALSPQPSLCSPGLCVS